MRTRRGERFHPFRIRIAPIQLRRAHDQHQVRRKLLDEVGNRLAADSSRLAGRQAQLDDPALCEQRQVGAGRAELLPVESGGGSDVHFTRRETLLARRRSNGIERLIDEQVLVTGDEIAGCKFAA